MRNTLIKTLAVAVAFVAVAGFAPDEETGYPEIVTKKELYAKNDFRGKKAPKMEVDKWLAGGKFDTKGKVILVDFWATWCPPCREGIPKLNTWAKKFKDDLIIVGISSEENDTVTEFMKKTAMNYNVAVDAKKRMNDKLGVAGIPHVMIISADGIVRWQGFPESAEDKLTTEKIAQIIGQSKKDYAAKVDK